MMGWFSELFRGRSSKKNEKAQKNVGLPLKKLMKLERTSDPHTIRYKVECTKGSYWVIANTVTGLCEAEDLPGLIWYNPFMKERKQTKNSQLQRRVAAEDKAK